MSGYAPRACLAIAWRQLASFLANPVGYIFILGFVMVVGATTFLPDAYFLRNVADFGGLYVAMPWILAAVLPALAMGSWASEREHGTEELVLTMPVTVADAVIGKYLAVVTFFTLALLCNISSALMIVWLGDPDGGQIVVNFLGWWVAGLGYAALALLGSVLVGHVAVAFVIGELLCLGFALLLQASGVLAPFDRGSVSLDLVMVTAAVAVAAVGGAVFVLGSRRWRLDDLGGVAIRGLQMALVVVIAINLAGVTGRYQLRADFTTAGLGSISATSQEMIDALPAPAELVLAISHPDVLPERLAVRADELIGKARAIARASDGRIGVEILRPRDPFDAAGRRARETYRIASRPSMARTAVGLESVDVFLGAAVVSGPELRTIPYFDPGLAIEYELVRALRRATLEAQPPSAVTVELVVSDPAPAFLADEAERLLAWAERERADVTTRVVRVDDAAAAAAAHGLTLRHGDDETEGAGVVGAVVTGPRFTARVPTLWSPWDVETDLAAAIRRARRQLPVVGVVTSQLVIHRHEQPIPGDPARRSIDNPGWGAVRELSAQYEVRPIAPAEIDPAAMDDVGMLMVPLPSSLTRAGLARIEAWIAAGRPALLLVDAMPMGSPRLAPAAQSRSQGGGAGRADPMDSEDTAVGLEGVHGLLAGLGIEAQLDQVVLTPYKPGFSWHQQPDAVVWADETSGDFADASPFTRGVASVMLPWPGLMHASDSRPEGLTITPLIQLAPDITWGTRSYLESVLAARQQEAAQPVAPYAYRSPADAPPLFAAAIGGEPSADAPAVNVVVVADVDFISDDIYQGIYRRARTGFEVDVVQGERELAGLRNVQFFENVVDVLMGHRELLDLRTQRVEPRPLTYLEERRAAAAEERSLAIDAAEEAVREALTAANEALTAQAQAIMAREDIDGLTKRNEIAALKQQAEARIVVKYEMLRRQEERAKREARAAYRNDVAEARSWIRIWAIGVPALVVLALIAVVVLIRLAGERMDIPAARDRRHA